LDDLKEGDFMTVRDKKQKVVDLETTKEEVKNFPEDIGSLHHQKGRADQYDYLRHPKKDQNQTEKVPNEKMEGAVEEPPVI